MGNEFGMDRQQRYLLDGESVKKAGPLETGIGFRAGLVPDFRPCRRKSALPASEMFYERRTGVMRFFHIPKHKPVRRDPAHHMIDRRLSANHQSRNVKIEGLPLPTRCP